MKKHMKKEISISNPKILINDITKILNNLVKVVSQENELLQIGLVSDIASAVQKKIALFETFHNLQMKLDMYITKGGKFDQNHPSMMKLKNLFNELNNLNQRNEILIKSNLEVSDNIVQIYKSHVKQYAIRQSAYNENGTILYNKIEKAIPAMGLNNEI